MRVAFAASAEADLQAIGDYIARDDPWRAVTFVAELRSACEGLADFPRRFPVVPDFENVRQRIYGKYLISYRIEEDIVSVVAFTHAARDNRRLS